MGLLWPTLPTLLQKQTIWRAFACPDSVGWGPWTLSIPLGVKNRKGITVLHTELEGEETAPEWKTD